MLRREADGPSGRLPAALLVLMTVLMAGGILPAQDTGQTNGSADQEDTVIIDEIVAKVNSDIITKTDLEAEVNRIRIGIMGANASDPEKGKQLFDEQYPRILRNMIISRMMYQRAEELGMLAQMQQDVDAYIKTNIMDPNGVPTIDVLKQLLQQQGTSYEDFRKGIEDQYVQSRLNNAFVYSKVTILTDEIESFYQENIEQFTEPATVELAEIVLDTEGKNASQVRTLAEDIVARVKAGESFEELARQYSDNSATAQRGGRSGTFTREQLSDVLAEPAFRLEAGQVTDVIETDFGFAILKVLGKTPATPKPLEEVRAQIVNFLREKKAQPYLKQFLDQLRDESYVYVAPKYQEQFDVQEIL
ncbi:MAG TPA: peptidyl-prolyl cis-trans isomerase [Acidobacteriota bacterium]|nr:peptidyl-prolyl cis-trans isomerase [Acidobacteriota bacterium]